MLWVLLLLVPFAALVFRKAYENNRGEYKMF